MTTNNGSSTRRFRYDAPGLWFKGNTHIHSTASDGGKTFAELAEMYAARGYAFLFRTDHSVASDVAADGGAYPLRWLDGIELNGLDERGANYHIVVLGRVRGFVRGMPLSEALAVAASPGNVTILAHPCWMGNSFEDALCKRFAGVEVYNHVCHWINGRGDSGAYWSQMLDLNPETLGLASDDTHLVPKHPGWDGGWIVCNAASCDEAAIMDAVRRGRFYSSTGPSFASIELDADGAVVARTSPVVLARLVGPRYFGAQLGRFGGPAMTDVRFEIPPDWSYAYLEIEDAAGRRAWTNTLFT